jgi:hypothetical protein
MQGDVLQKSMIWADVNPLSCFGTHDGTTAEAAVVKGLGLPKLKKMVHTFVSGLIKKKLLAKGAVVVVLKKEPWSYCEKLGSLLTKLDVHQVDHPMSTGMWARGQCQEARTLLAMQAPNSGEKWSVFVYVCHTTCLTLLRRYCHTSSSAFCHAPRSRCQSPRRATRHILHRRACWRIGEPALLRRTASPTS